MLFSYVKCNEIFVKALKGRNIILQFIEALKHYNIEAFLIKPIKKSCF